MKHTFSSCSSLPENNHYKIIHRLLAKFFEMNCIEYDVLASWDDGYGQTGYRVRPFGSMPVTILIRPNLCADLVRGETIETLVFDK
jgi:hypothetical protein